MASKEGTPTGPRWGLWRMPEHPRPGETKYVRYALALPTSWRGFVQAFDSREEAADAWAPGYFIREIAE